MATNKRLGIFFGSDTIHVVETTNQFATKNFAIAQNLFENPENAPDDTPREIKVTADIQRNLREQKITASEAYLSLPTQDTIFRSFTIPNVSHSELGNVVEFESRKYIPFHLDELFYTYHALPFSENSVKRLRILFVAIRKDLLTRYTSILEQAGLRISFIEPAALSLMRALHLRGKLPMDRKIALIKTNMREGKIIIIDKGVPQFIRDFKLLLPSAAPAESDPQFLKTRLFNEIRISLDYYDRQYGQEKVKGIITIMENDGGDSIKTLEGEMGIPVTLIAPEAILGVKTPTHVETLNAFGIGLRNRVALPIKFDLSVTGIKTPKKEELRFNLTSEQLLILKKIGGSCLAILLFLFFILMYFEKNAQAKISILTQQQGIYADLDIESIKTKIEEADKKLTAYQSIPTKSRIAFFLVKLSKLLPEGVWLANINFQYDDTIIAAKPTQKKSLDDIKIAASKLSVEFGGFASGKNPNHQIRLINTFLLNLKNDSEFSRTFQSISLANAQTQGTDDNLITNFKIRCQ